MSRLRTLYVGAVLVVCCSLSLLYFATQSQAVPFSLDDYLPAWSSSGNGGSVQFTNPRPEIAEQLMEFADRYEKTYAAERWYGARTLNRAALQRLSDCHAGVARCRDSENTVVILGSMHFGLLREGGTSGETIWAGSTVEALTALNYTLIHAFGHMDLLLMYQELSPLVHVPVIIMDGPWIESCIARSPDNYKELEAKEEFAPGDWQSGTKGCIKKEGFEDGIPLWKIFVWHYWKGSRSPLGPDFTLAPVDYAVEGDPDPNQFLGFSVETKCEALPFHPFSTRDHQAMILGKQYAYYRGDNFLYHGILDQVTAAMPQGVNGSDTSQGLVDFKLVGTVEGDFVLPGGVENRGRLPRAEFYDLVGRSKAMIGIGRPMLSPSPYDALCCGVPFINPVSSWNKSDPDNRRYWVTQHAQMMALDPPYVYHSFRDNEASLEKALRSAIDTPINRFIPTTSTRESVRARHAALVETDWLKVAEERVELKYTAEGKEFPFLL